MYKKIKIISVVVLVTATLFSCKGALEDVQKMTFVSHIPVAEVANVDAYYTEIGTLKAHLKSPLLLDYTNQEFPYQEFPNGLEVFFYDENKRTIIRANYAIRYETTSLVDLRDNVEIITADSTHLKASQMYWDQTLQWLYTDTPYTITFADGSFNNGGRFDSSQDFNIFLSRNNNGVQVIDTQDNKTTLQDE